MALGCMCAATNLRVFRLLGTLRNSWARQGWLGMFGMLRASYSGLTTVAAVVGAPIHQVGARGSYPRGSGAESPRHHCPRPAYRPRLGGVAASLAVLGWATAPATLRLETSGVVATDAYPGFCSSTPAPRESAPLSPACRDPYE